MDQIQPKSEGGLAALFDFGFNRFITLSVVKVLYMLGMALIVLVSLAMIISAFSTGVLAGLGAIVLAPILALIYLIMLRIWLELVVVIFRIGENTTKLVELRGGTPATSGGAG